MEGGSGKLAYVDVPEPVVQPYTAKIKIAYSGICGSDYHIVAGYETPGAPRTYPLTLGHEYCGTIAEVGEGVTNVKVGDRVTALVTVNYCGKCLSCLKGEFYKCAHVQNMGYECDGSMTDYIVVPSAGIFKLPDSVSFEEAAQIEPACVAGNAVLVKADLKPNDTVVVMGAGPIGLLILQFAKLQGAKVIVIDLSTETKKLALAKQFGADYILENDKCDAITEVRKLTLGRGVDYLFECTAVEGCINQASLMVRARGKFIELGITPPEGTSFKFFLLLVMQGIDVLCSFGHLPSMWEKVIELLAEKKINTKDLVTHKFKYTQFEEAFALKGPERVKVLLHP
ncbi:MAG: alcohol dehydrogenase catalytic domain-containing protein [Spirochaetales bacterium]|nr:alcohol dehydrogenase catalytic domain-containing protein [Spirochaetales bacterium]